jgi:hypothetical protein
MSKAILLIVFAALAVTFSFLYMQSVGRSIPLGDTIPIGGNRMQTMTVTVPHFIVEPGHSQTRTIIIHWEGAAKIVIRKIEFESDAELFNLGKSLPFAVATEGGQGSTEIPLTISAPAGEQALHKVVQMRVTAFVGGNTMEQVSSLMINPLY